MRLMTSIPIQFGMTVDKRHSPSPETGNALSFALKLKNRNNGTNQTQIPKNVATSANPGGSKAFCVIALALTPRL